MSKKHFNFKSSIRDWYIRAFPSDELGYRINPLATFAGAVKCMADGGDIYKYLGVGDSLVRENVEYSEKKPKIAAKAKPDPADLGRRASVAAGATVRDGVDGGGIKL